MKLLYSHRTHSADGQYVHIESLTDALTARGVTVEISGPGDGGRKSLAAAPSRRAGSSLPGAIYEAAEMAYSGVGLYRLQRAASRLSPDVLYERYNLFYHSGAWLAQQRGLPFLLEVNAPLAAERAATRALSLRRFANMSERAIWRAADMVLPVTEVLARHVEAAGVPRERIRVTPNGVCDAFLNGGDGAMIRSKFGVPADALVLGFAGFVRDWHRVDRIVRYLSSRPELPIWFLLVGDGPSRVELERLAQESGVASRFVCTGVVQRAEMPTHIAAFDIALQPAATVYASPLKLFEYMALGKAILATDRENIKETLTHGENAVLFSDQDEGALFSALDVLIGDAALRARLGEAARETLLRRNLTWAHNAARVEHIAQSLLERRA